MRLSTTINFFIAPYTQSFDACVEALEQYRDLGFSNLDAIFCGAENPGSPLRRDGWEDWVAAIGQAARERGITFVQSHVPFYNFCTMPASVPADAEEIVDRSIQAAGILGAPWTVAHPATALGAKLPFVASKAQNLDYFNRHLEVCQRYGVGLALENMADFEGGGRHRWYCAYAEELCDLIDTLDQGSGLVGACWDFGHANLMYADQSGALELLGQRLKVVHVHDNSGQRDDHIAPFRGTVDWFSIMQTLARMDYRHDFSFEVRRMLQPGVPDEVKNSLWRHLKVVGEFLIAQYDAACKGEIK